jgi:hypothetical protein
MEQAARQAKQRVQQKQKLQGRRRG